VHLRFKSQTTYIESSSVIRKTAAHTSIPRNLSGLLRLSIRKLTHWRSVIFTVEFYCHVSLTRELFAMSQEDKEHHRLVQRPHIGHFISVARHAELPLLAAQSLSRRSRTSKKIRKRRIRKKSSLKNLIPLPLLQCPDQRWKGGVLRRL